MGAAANVRHTRVVEKVTHKLLMTAVADPSERVRKAVLKALHGSTALDDFLAQVGGARGPRACMSVWGGDRLGEGGTFVPKIMAAPLAE